MGVEVLIAPNTEAFAIGVLSSRSSSITAQRRIFNQGKNVDQIFLQLLKN